MYHWEVLCLTLVAMESACGRWTVSKKHRHPLVVGSFNIKHFGNSKMSSAKRADRITSIVQRYDIISILETRDSKGTSLCKLWSKLNDTDDWGLVVSEAVGRRSYKEQYVFFYRLDKAKVFGTFQDPDDDDVYEREPFTVLFQYWSVKPKKLKKVALMALHATPKDVPAEMEALPSSIKEAASEFRGEGGVVAMGDFNADCSYANAEERGEMDIFTQSKYKSLIDDDADTTTGKTDCSYDRIIVTGNDIRPKNAQVYDFREDLDISTSAAQDISDHWPVEFELH